jgi:hypothetical protein
LTFDGQSWRLKNGSGTDAAMSRWEASRRLATAFEHTTALRLQTVAAGLLDAMDASQVHAKIPMWG